MISQKAVGTLEDVEKVASANVAINFPEIKFAATSAIDILLKDRTKEHSVHN